MKSNRKSISMLIFTILMVLICILITACSGVEIQPDDNGGVTIVPGGNIGERLKTPEIISVEGYTIMWGKVDGAASYEVTIDNIVLITTATQINLEKYFGDINIIQVNIRAKAAEGSGIFDSALCTYIYTIPGNPISSVKGIGDAVNLLTGKYTEFAGGTTRIWNEALFARLRADDRVTNYGYQIAEVTYCESLDSYLNSLTESINNKTNINTSVGYGSFVKATSNFSYSVGTNYKSTTENSTKAVFYDMDYKYVGKSVEIYGYNDKNKLSSLISDEFKADAAAVQAGTMTPAAFIDKYGTHIVTAGIYGAKFNIHYEMLTTTDKAQTTFGENIEAKIGANIQGSLYGVDLGLGIENTTTANKEAFKETNSTDMYTSFTATAIGGGAVNMMATDLGQFAAICDKWTEGLQDSNNHILIDVPDGSLFFVWDFLGDEYSEAKTILYNYFYAVCDDQYYSLKNKISDMYSDSYTFDENTGTITVNLSGLQTRDEANLGELNYKDDTDGTIVFDSATGVFTVYSKYNNYDVQRVVFIGKYGVIDHKGELIETTFDPFCIKFASGWNRDIVLELVNFGFEAPNVHCGIDFSQVNSENIKIIVSGKAYVRGGDANVLGSAGLAAINAPDKNLTITGAGDIEIIGGNGIDGTDGASIDIDGKNNYSKTPGNGTNGSDGGPAVANTKLTINCSGTVILIGGNGGKGGDGGTITGESNSEGYADLPAGGNGGNGGNGGIPIEISCLTIVNCEKILLQYGNGGNGGDGAMGGNAYEVTDVKPDNGGDGGNGGNGGHGFIAGNGGVGGKGGHSFGAAGGLWGTSDYKGTSGDGGDGGNGGNRITAIIYTTSSLEMKQGIEGGKAGSYGSRGTIDHGGGVMGNYGVNGKNGLAGSIDDTYYNAFENKFSEKLS